MTKKINNRLLSSGIFLITILTLSFIGVLLYTGNRSQALANEQSPQILAIKQVEIEIIDAHLWLEEVLSGDRGERITTVYANFKKADNYLNLLLNGGELGSKLFFAIEDLDVKHKIREVILVKDTLYELTYLRYAQLGKAQAGTSVDKLYDDVFERFMQKSNAAVIALLDLQEQNINKYNFTQERLIISVIALGVFILIIFVLLERFKNKKQKQLLYAIDKLKDSETQFRSLIEQSGDAMYLSDFDGNIIAINNKACEYLGYERDELLKLNLDDIDTTFISNDHQKKLWNNLILGEYQRLETKHKCKNGTLKDVEVTIGLYKYSNKKSILGFARDITERKAANEALLASQIFNQTMLDTSPDLIYVYDLLERKNIYSNQGLIKILGFNIDEIQSMGEKLLPNLMHPDDFNVYLNTVIPKYQTTKDGESIVHEYRMKYKNGNWGWFNSKESIFVRQEDGSPKQIFGVISDVTSRKYNEIELEKHRNHLEDIVKDRTESLAQSQEALLNLVDDLNSQSVKLEKSNAQYAELNKELESFSYSVSHDLRAPLRGIDGFSFALLEDYGEILDEQGKSYLNRVRLGSQKMALLIDEMLNLSRLGRMALKPTTVNLSEIAQLISSALCELEPERKFEFIIAKDISGIADPILIRSVLQNLLENAWKFSSKLDHSKIEFGELNIEGKRTYFVKDNGVGFNMQYENKLFTPFQRLHQESEFEGTGIGLTTVQRIIHRHNGALWAKSEVNAGATFYFTLNS